MHLLIIGILGSLILFSLGYLIGIKRYMYLIAGYKPGRIEDEEAVAKSFRTYGFGGGVLVASSYSICIFFIICSGGSQKCSRVVLPHNKCLLVTASRLGQLSLRSNCPKGRRYIS